MALLEEVDELVGGPRPPHVGVGRVDQLVGALDVVGVVRTSRRHDAVEDDLGRLLDGEARALDVVGEVGLVEREDPRVVALARQLAARWRLGEQRRCSNGEKVDPAVVERGAVAHALRLAIAMAHRACRTACR